MSPPAENPRPILVTRPLPAVACDLLTRAGFAHDLLPEALRGRPEALGSACVGRKAILCLVVDRIDAPLLDAAAPTCKVIATVSVGFDHIDLAVARRHGIVITHTPDVLTDTTADLAWALLMATARRLGEAERDLRAGRWHGLEYMQYWGADVHGATLGIVGGGRIGAAVARRAAGFDMRLLCSTRSAATSAMPAGTQFVDLDTLLRESDFVSLNVPLNDQTRHMIAAPQLRRMKPTAILINTSRGPVIDEAALVDALRAGQIAGAGLDVFEHEPRVSPGLLDLQNVVLLPHIGSASRATREKMACMAAESVIAILRGDRPAHVVPAL